MGFCDPAIGREGARPEQIRKLMSAASWWGPGPSGWQKVDYTWLLIDKKDMCGNIMQEQGRLIWRVGRERGQAWRRIQQNEPEPLMRPGARLRVLLCPAALLIVFLLVCLSVTTRRFISVVI